MSLINERYEIAPQLRDYDVLPTDWIPYTMFSQAANYSSESVNTDERGQRFSIDNKGKRVSVSNIEGEFDLIVGASTAFGVGSTGDDTTIASRLSSLSGRQILSLTGRAYNSHQELLLFLEKLHDFNGLGRIILVSGVNNLYLSAFSQKNAAPFFWSNSFNDLTRTAGLSKKKRILSLFFDSINGTQIDWRRINKANFVKKIYEGYCCAVNSSQSEKINVENAAQRTIQDLDIFKKLAKSIGAQLTYFLQPVSGWMNKSLVNQEEILFNATKSVNLDILHAVNNEAVYEQYAAIISKFCESTNVSFHDLNKLIKAHNEWMFVDRVHLTDTGNLLVAEQLHRYLEF